LSLALLAIGIGATVATWSTWKGGQRAPIPLSEAPHVHGIAVDLADPSRLFLATPEGLYEALSDGMALPPSKGRNDVRGFTPHPTEPRTLFASSHAEDGSNLGMMLSRDGGRSWRQLSLGLDGPVDFHVMAISRADPSVIYGHFDGVQLTRDGGATWTRAGPAPGDILDLAASVADPNVLYAATMTGLSISRDGGRTWRPTGTQGQPATMVTTCPDDGVYAFQLGLGLLRAPEFSLSWTRWSEVLGEQALRHLACDPFNADRLLAANPDGVILESLDTGRTWKPFPRARRTVARV
jgi:hypothetical protein